MPLDLALQHLAQPCLTEALLRGPGRTLQEIKNRNEKRWAQGTTSKEFQNRKEHLRQRIRDRVGRGESFAQATRVVGRERLLLSIYLDDLGTEWLPPFDHKVAVDILGEAGQALHPSRCRQLTQFFFRRFDQIHALAFICGRLRESYTVLKGDANSHASAWALHRSVIFAPEGPSNVVRNAEAGESLKNLIERFTVPKEGRFVESLRNTFLLESLRQCRFGEAPTTLEEIAATKTDTAHESMPLGAAALQIIVRRVAKEGRGKWPEAWQKWIVPLGCDPRQGRALPETARWWGWATDSELKLAQQGMIGLSLRFFFDFLSGTVTAYQWEERRKFLDSLFKAGKILDARLALNSSCLGRLPSRQRDPWSVAKLNATTDDTCMIALRCGDDVFILEGTHSFGLRAFHRTFPIRGFWERERQAYRDCELRISPSNCPIFIRHAPAGKWIFKFVSELRSQFHVEWGGVGR